MKTIVWTTDPHLNFCSGNVQHTFFNRLAGDARDFFGQKTEKPDFVLVGGDIGEANNVDKYLKKMAKRLDCQVLFVLGNHDYYRSSVDYANRKVAKAISYYDNLTWLDRVSYVEITPTCAVIGHSGWSDGRYGNWLCSNVDIADYHYIADLMVISQSDKLKVMQELAAKAAYHIKNSLKAAFDKYSKVFLLTHIPPWREAAVNRGRISDDNWVPHFASKIMGETIESFMRGCKDHLTVLCGHSHGNLSYAMGSDTIVNVAKNIVCLTGDAQYYFPKINGIFKVE